MQRRSCKRRLEHEGIQEKRIGWEAWTRTRIARSRVWSPTNWTTSQPTDAPRCDGSIEEQKGIAAGSRGSGEPRFDRIRVNGNGVGRQPGTAANAGLARNSGCCFAVESASTQLPAGAGHWCRAARSPKLKG